MRSPEAGASAGAVRRGGPVAMARALWAYRSFVAAMVARDLRARYRQSLLGATWAVATPLVTMAIYALVFSEVMRARLPGTTDRMAYALFLMAGLFPWGLFAETVTRCQTVFLEQGNLIKKAAFPRSALPVAAALTALVNFSVVFVLFLLLLALTGRWPGPVLLAFLPILALQQALALGLGVLVGTLQVFFRDAGHFTGLALQFWFWLTPVVYPLAVLPDAVRPWLERNPLTPLFGAYQGLVLEGAMPHWDALLPAAALAAAALLLGYAAFRGLSGELVDQL